MGAFLAGTDCTLDIGKELCKRGEHPARQRYIPLAQPRRLSRKEEIDLGVQRVQRKGWEH